MSQYTDMLMQLMKQKMGGQPALPPLAPPQQGPPQQQGWPPQGGLENAGDWMAQQNQQQTAAMPFNQPQFQPYAGHPSIAAQPGMINQWQAQQRAFQDINSAQKGHGQGFFGFNPYTPPQQPKPPWFGGNY